MLFNPDISKQALEVIFSNKKNISTFQPLVFIIIPVKQVSDTIHIGMIPDCRQNFDSHIEKKIAKANQGLGILWQLKKWASYRVLDQVYKMYTRPHLDYGDVVYHSANLNKSDIF